MTTSLLRPSTSKTLLTRLIDTPAVDELQDVLRACPADVLFRKASSTLVANKIKKGPKGLLRSAAAFRAVRRMLCGPKKKKRDD